MKNRPLPFWILLALVSCLPGRAMAGDEASDERRQEALQNIQDALDEDPDEAARILGATPVAGLDTDALEEIGNRAFQFVQMKRLERERDALDAQRRLREWQDFQNSRPR